MNLEKSARSRADRPSARLFAAGGCHVEGFPVGPELGFLEVAKKLLANQLLEVEVHTNSRVQVKNLQSLCVSDADIILLQIGHFELIGGMPPPGAKRAIPEEAKQHIPLPSPFERPLGRLRWSVRAYFKLIFQLLGYGISVDSVRFETLLTAGLVGLATSFSGSVFLLSPLRCADPSVSRIRRAHLQCFERAAKRSNVGYIDCFLDKRFVGAKPELYYDAIHLSAEGHHLLGQIVAERMSATIVSRSLLVDRMADRWNDNFNGTV